MSDNYGPTQPVVLDPKDHSWDNVVFSRGVTPLTADWNLIGQLAQEKSKHAQLLPSGWLQVGDIMQVASGGASAAELGAADGQVITSLEYASDTFKVISNGGLRAVVAGMVLDIRGTNSLDDNNIIELDSMASHAYGRLDLVFLEVWRELVNKDSFIFKYGNVDAGTLGNDINISQRVQVRYRIRTKIGGTPGGVSLASNPDGFLDSSVVAEGALPAGVYSLYHFVNQVDNGDHGLWRAGDGSDAAKDSLGTVDGYSYAIPMFAVYRRGLADFFGTDYITSTKFAKGDGRESDRPDGLFYDVVYSSDIVDLRHRIMAGRDLSSLLDKTFRSLQQGTLKTRRGLVRGNAGFVEMPGGSDIMKGEEFGANITGLPYRGTMQSSGLVPQRALCNATVTHHNNVISVSPPSGTWVVGNFTVQLGTSGYVNGGLPIGAYRVDSKSGIDLVSDAEFAVSVDGGTLHITVPVGSSLVGYTTAVQVQLPVTYQASTKGFLDVPNSILEIRCGSDGPILPPADGKVIPVHTTQNTDLLLPVSPLDFIANRGAEAASTWDQGIDVVTHITQYYTNTFSLSLPDYKLNGHKIVGIKSIQREVSTGVYGPPERFDASRIDNTGSMDYIATAISTEGGSSLKLRVTLQAATTFFETSRQGCGITDTFEVKEVTPLYIGGAFYIDTATLPLLAICQSAITQGGSVQGLPYAYANGQRVLLTVLTDGAIPLVNRLPVIGGDSYVDGNYLPTWCKISFQTTVIPSWDIKVPVIVNTGINTGVLPDVSYVAYYMTSGYQGTSSSVGTVGTIESAGPHVLTTSGSGAIVDYSFSGAARFNMAGAPNVLVAGAGTNWEGLIYAGDYVYKESQPFERYRVASVTSGTELVLVDPYYGDQEEVAFKSIRKGVPASGNICIVDRMPTAAKDGYLAGSSAIWSGVGSSVSGLPGFATADPVSALRGDVKVGSGVQAYQGRTGLLLSVSGSDRYQLPAQYPDVAYGPVQCYGTGYFQKMYQSYLYTETLTGRVYMVVLAGETQTDNALVRFTGHVGTDVVDIFEVLGRPLAPRG